MKIVRLNETISAPGQMHKLAFVSLAIVVAVVSSPLTAAGAANVVKIARSFPDGGGYALKGTGVPEAIEFGGERILSKVEPTTYCSGFTFTVVMKAAAERGLLAGKAADEVRKFQKQWYGATKESGETQCAFALEQLGIGTQIKPERARPGDFVQFWRTSKSGHSAVFLGWVTEGRRKVGLKYRSSQPATKGIGDHIEYFADVEGHKGKVLPERIYFGRLDGR
jgi:hypothetical protein